MIIDNEYFEVHDTRLRVQGLFATKDIPKGTCILIEEHIVCLRNIEHESDEVNSYFDFPQFKPENDQDSTTDLYLLGICIEKLDQINERYGNHWYDHFYKLDYDTFNKQLTEIERKYIAQLSVKYQPLGGFRLIVDIYNVIINNSFENLTCHSNNISYYGLDYIASKFKRSCQPNCRKITFPKHITITTLIDVQKGSELTINYDSAFINPNNECEKCITHFKMYESQFTTEMIMRENSNDHYKVSFEISKDIPNYLSNEMADKTMSFGGLEIWYHLLYDLWYYLSIDIHTLKDPNDKDTSSIMYVSLLFIYYIKSMMEDISLRNSISEYEVLIFLITNTKISPLSDYDQFFNVINFPIDKLKSAFKYINGLI